jgi:EmrB/QacA subfamily drug resistance transporter
MCLALALVVSSVASLNIALPNLATSTGASQAELQWIVDAYVLVFAGLLFVAGAIGDKYGRRHTLVIGLAIFGGAHAVGALIDDPGLLIAVRGVAGIGSALVMPSTLSIITTTFSPDQRGKAVGTWAGVASGGAVVGLLLSGTLLEVTDWQWIFATNAIWAGLALLLVLAWAPQSRDRDQPPLDYFGAVLSATGLAGAIFATIEGPERGWSSGLVLGGYAFGAVMLTAFVAWELRARYPLLDPRLFARRGFRIGSLSLSLQFFALFGFMFGIIQFLQLVRGYSPLEAALALLPLGLTVAMLSRGVAPKLVARIGPRPVNATGLAVLAVGFLAISTLEADSSYLHVLAGLLPLAAGIGLATTPATSAIVQSLPASKQGVASAMNDTAREVGAAVGIAVLGSILNNGYRDGIAEQTEQLPPEAAEGARDSLAFVVEAADEFGAPGQELLGAAQASFADGFTTTMQVAAAIMAVGAVIVFGRGRRSDAGDDRSDELADSEPDEPEEPGAVTGHGGVSLAPAPVTVPVNDKDLR